jgi:molybdenum cofactor cytidylyltransferase
VKFGPVRVADAGGVILAHSLRLPAGAIRKGTVLGPDDIARLRAAGITEVVAARLESGDVHEDAAAARLAGAIAGAHLRTEAPFTGRTNLYSQVSGLIVVDRARIDRLNRLDPAITVATLPEYAVVEPGRMVATVKIIPFAVEERALAAALGLGEAIRVAPFRPMKVGLVATELATLKPSVMDKTRRLLEERLARGGSSLSEERRVAHDAAAVAAALDELRRAGNDLLIVFGASAMVDAKDVVPAGIEAAGGEIRHLGMPVDPGNLLVLGAIGGTPVVGAPGCARSPKENGFDWILNRLLAGIPVTSDDVTGLGVGGLLMEIVSRPQPRQGPDAAGSQGRASRIAALILAAGESRRMGGPNKLVAMVAERPLVRIVAEAAAKSRAVSVTVVTGSRAGDIAAALAGLDVALVHNPEFARGLSTSLKAGLAGLPADIDGVIVLLGDMPGVTTEMIDRLIDAFRPEEGALIVVPTVAGRRGNPVLWSARFFDELKAIAGDTGGRQLIAANGDAVVEVELGPAVGLDVDTPADLAALGGRLPEL